MRPLRLLKRHPSPLGGGCFACRASGVVASCVVGRADRGHQRKFVCGIPTSPRKPLAVKKKKVEAERIEVQQRLDELKKGYSQDRERQGARG